MATMKTSELWRATHNALCDKQWSRGRQLLDELGTRSDNSDMLASAAEYGCPATLSAVIQDRIDLVNAKTE